MGAIELLLVRHGESMGNVAASEAQAAGAHVIDIGMRDADVGLSPTGVRQAEAVGDWLCGLPADQQPDMIFSSPYRRARQSCDLALQAARVDLPVVTDERLRDRELGILDLLTSAGVAARFPEEAARRRWLGKFYYRPPGGESWADLALRLRTFLADLDRTDNARRVLIVCHDAVILVLRYICEAHTEEGILAIAAKTSVRNASITRLIRPEGTGLWQLDTFDAAAHLVSRGAPVTEHGGDTDVLPR